MRKGTEMQEESVCSTPSHDSHYLNLVQNKEFPRLMEFQVYSAILARIYIIPRTAADFDCPPADDICHVRIYFPSSGLCSKSVSERKFVM